MTGLVYPQFSSTSVELSAPHVVDSLPPLEEFFSPVYKQVFQEQVVPGEMTMNIVENPIVQEQVIVQENPELQVMERIQEHIVDIAGLVKPQSSFTAVEASAPQVVGSLPPFQEFDAPVYNQIHQEQIVAGETTQNIVQNSAVQEHEIVQENSELQVMERIQEQIVEITKEVPQERVQQRTVEQIVRVPVPQIQEQVVVQEIPQVVERIQEQIVEPIEVLLHEHVQALSVLENVLHERQRRFDHCVQVLEREKEKLWVLEERGVVPPHELQSLRSRIQSGKDAIADAVRDLYECKQQIKRRRSCESMLADGMTDFQKSVNIGNHFPAEHI